MAMNLSDDDEAYFNDGPSRVTDRSNAYTGSGTSFAQSSFQLPSSIDPNASTSFQNRTVGDGIGNDEGEETKVRELMRRWIDERNAPDLLVWHGDLVQDVLKKLEGQADAAAQLQEHPNTSEEEHFTLMLVQMEMERIKFVLRSYLRCRLQKIEQYTPFILATPEVQEKLSELEQNHVIKYGDLIAKHFTNSTLAQLPEDLQGLADKDPNMPGMITEPKKSTPVFVRALEDCGYLNLPDGKSFEIRKGSIRLVQYQYIEPLITRGQMELV